MDTWLGLVLGVDLAMMYLAGWKAAIVFWVYGLNKFSTDIHFWLGFKPTKFWQLCWAMLPVSIYVSHANIFYHLSVLTTLTIDTIIYLRFYFFQIFVGAQLSRMITFFNSETPYLEGNFQIYKASFIWLALIAFIVACSHVRTILTFLMKNVSG